MDDPLLGQLASYDESATQHNLGSGRVSEARDGRHGMGRTVSLESTDLTTALMSSVIAAGVS